MKINLKKDKYKSKRGGHSRLLDIKCGKCNHHLCFYQKDGPGVLLRMYEDRIFEKEKNTNIRGKGLKCKNCNQVVAFKMAYKKENRPAFRLFPGSITKKLSKIPK